ncbi:MAG: hypothetical protein C5B52_19220 [Bacteroidetes bacterium]|nr:MAG: hypothetical protein C5B52_19220 [Bacteroidota bacterium]
MRVPVFVFAVFFTTIFSCKKSEQSECDQAMVRWEGDPAVDGLGWTLRLGNNKVEIPTNLPRVYMIDSLPVSVCFVPTSKQFQCECIAPYPMVEIVSIKRR